MLQVLTEAGQVASAYDFSTLDFGVVTATFTAALGVTAGIVVTFIAIKKGWSFLKKNLRGA